MKTPNLDNLINDLKAYDRNNMLSDDGRNQLNEYEAIKRALSLYDVVYRSEQLKAVQKLKDFAYEVCPLHREDDLEEIAGSL